MRVPFVKLSPNGNTTILLRGPLSPEDHTRFTTRVVNADHIGAEQSGTIRTDGVVPSLTMMAGEFCLNATRAFAALLALEGKLEGEGRHRYGEVRVSGVEELVQVRVEILNEAQCRAAVRLRMAARPEIRDIAPGARLVFVPGISHLVLDAELYPLPPEQEIVSEAAEWRARLKLASTAPAVGIVRMWRDPVEHGIQTLRIVPVVWVSAGDHTCVETACGSGSLAAVLAADTAGKPDLWHVVQAGGILSVELSEDNAGFAAWVGGDVQLTASGDAFF